MSLNDIATAFFGALLVAIVIHTGVLIRWTGKMSALMESHDKRLSALENEGSRVAVETAARLDAHVEGESGIHPRRRRTDRPQDND